MKKLEKLTESFKIKYESFITGCDCIELDDKWDKEANGEMDVYYENELLSVILSLIITDNKIRDEEVRYLNENFRFSYTVDELKIVYQNCGDEIRNYFDNSFRAGYGVLQSINTKLAEAYKELFELICEIIAESDGVVSDAEKQMISALKL